MSSVLVIYQAGLHARSLDGILDTLHGLSLRVITCTVNSDASPSLPLETEIEALLTESDHIVIAGVSLHFLRQLIDLNDSYPLTATVLYGLTMGLDVFAVQEAVDPRHYLPANGLPAHQMARQIDRLLSELASLGIRLLPAAELSVLSPDNRYPTIVTLKDVQDAIARGDDPTQYVTGRRLTPAATDWLRENAVPLRPVTR